ncbi:hypothetical protein A3C57_01805 [Candidatus Nomurabacteria bacterium RIFCSPHIGHO2_02_FULL_33_12]|uniref:Polymerase nucleotidyl transferase domain-containing protein n=1 Tax=Candidatus Nomurabacteria bacterium RIFCSPLOWO2_01_FULL_33_17 TaxID=1801764 RepID=A0A1F6WP21_9BACT|nr:MAG: hypothetical protein A3C57_01805 [Candidatus Nomurabacteria bacterium RIFCSPHIGHO2_02_FULL_33_12]OGI83628.1 MAG: hypothetical protein A2903_02470 [Candidatus Nomurabacteria bacterium RIFCSPLOWO2_01_FULL_33_17]
MVRKTISKSIKNSIAKYKKRLIKEGIIFDKVILFGSYAKGNANLYSDIDIAIVSKYFGKNNFKEMSKLNALTYGVDTRIEAHPVSYNDFLNPISPFVFEIKKYGVLV